jgi:hypothetical protein
MRAMCTLPEPSELYGSIVHDAGAATTVWEPHIPHGSHMHSMGAPHALYDSHMGDVNQMCTLRTKCEPYWSHVPHMRTIWCHMGGGCALRQPDDPEGSHVGVMWHHVESLCTVCTTWESSGMREEPYAPYRHLGLSFGRYMSSY